MSTGTAWRYAIRSAAGAAVLVVGALAAGLLYEKIGEARDARRYPAPGKMVDVGALKLHLLCKGDGAPTVVIETGMAIPSFLWFPVQNEVAKVTRVCTYDRPGFGWSEPAPRPLSMSDQAAVLHTLLINAGVSGPYVMVGHSYGGALVRLFARGHRDEVAGMVLIESTEEQIAFSPDLSEVMRKQEGTTRRYELEAHFGVIRFQNRRDPVDAAAFSRPEYFQEWLAEENSMVTAPSEMKHPGGFGTLGNLPLVVIERGVPPPESEVRSAGLSPSRLEQRWTEAQQRLAGLSSDSELIVADKSGHNVNIEQPAIVVKAIEGVVGAVRAKTTLRAFSTR